MKKLILSGHEMTQNDKERYGASIWNLASPVLLDETVKTNDFLKLTIISMHRVPCVNSELSAS